MTSIDEIRKQFEQKLDDTRNQHEEKAPGQPQELPPPLPGTAAVPPPLADDADVPPPLSSDSVENPEHEPENIIAHEGDRIEFTRERVVKIFDAELGELRPSNLLRKCPFCNMPVEKDVKICEFCGKPLG